MKAIIPSIILGIVIGTALSLFLSQHSVVLEAKGEAVKEVTSPSLPDFTELAHELRPSVVNIVAFRKKIRYSIFSDPFFSTDQATGSGVFIDASGHIVTNNHVIDGAEKIVVTLHDGQQVLAELIGRDVRTDMAIIKVNQVQNFKFAKYAASVPEVGSWVIAIGSPLGFNHSFTQGIISALGRRQVQQEKSLFGYANFIQTSAAINPGNSGGPLVNLKGEIVGINTAIASETGGFQGIGLAIPANLAKKITGELIKEGHVPYVWIGAVLAEFSELTKSYLRKIGVDEDSQGVVLIELGKTSPASQSGLKEDDILLTFDNQQINNAAGFRYQLSQLRPGKNVLVEVLRQGKKIQLQMELKERPARVRDSIVIENKRKKIVD